MVKFAGKYELVKREKFYEYLKSIGTPEETAKKLDVEKSTLTVSVDGDLYTFSSDSSGTTHTLVFPIGKPFKEELTGFTLENVASLDGNKITLSSTSAVASGDRIYEFSDSGVTITYKSATTDVVGKRYLKRV